MFSWLAIVAEKVDAAVTSPHRSAAVNLRTASDVAIAQAVSHTQNEAATLKEHYHEQVFPHYTARRHDRFADCGVRTTCHSGR
jgi:hypothetical protein